MSANSSTRSLRLVKPTKAILTSIFALLKEAKSTPPKACVLEGPKMIEEGFATEQNFICFFVTTAAKLDSAMVGQLIKRDITVYHTSPTMMARLAETRSPPDLLAVVGLPFRIATRPAPAQQNIVVLDDINDPGNLGTILRTCDWFGIPHVMLVGSCAKPTGAKVIRASMGSIFRVQVRLFPVRSEAMSTLEKEGFSLLTTVVQGGVDFRTVSHHPGKKALIFGSESHGLHLDWLQLRTLKLTIPRGASDAESLNLGIAVGIIVAEFSKP